MNFQSNRKKEKFLIVIIGILIIVILLLMVLIHLTSNLDKNNNKENKNDVEEVIPTPSPTITPVEDVPLEPVETPTPTATLEPRVTPTSKPVINTNLSLSDCRNMFREKRAVVAGDSMAEGLTAYEVLDDENVVWYRGRRIDNMNEDMDKIVSYQPNYLFLTYGSNDLELWVGNVSSFINSYRNTLSYIKNTLPNTKIIINSILPVSEEALRKNNAYSYQELFNNELKKLAEEENISFLENSSFLYERENPFSTDGVHPKGFYYSLWAKNMASYLEKN